MLNRAYNSLIRVIGLSGRLFLVIAMAKYISPSDVGSFGIFQAGVMYAVYIVGLDFYAYSIRELAADSPLIYGEKIGSQLMLYGFTYLIVAPILTGVFILLELPSWLAIASIIFVFLEHINQEMTRVAEALGRPILAGNLTILRNGIWPYAALIGIIFVPSLRNINSILILWAFFGLISTYFTLKIIMKEFPITGKLAINWNWLKSGIIISCLFFTGTLAVRALFTLDKFFIKTLSVSELPAYILFSALGIAVLTIVEASIFSFSYPKMLQSPSNFKILRVLVKQSIGYTFTICLMLSTVLFLALPLLLTFIGHDAYIRNIDLAPLVLLSASIYALGLAPHYGLYALKMDKIIISANIIGLLVFLFLVTHHETTIEAKDILRYQIIAFSSTAIFKAIFFTQRTN